VHKFSLNLDCWPLAVSTLGDDLSDTELEAMFSEWDVAFARKERFVTLNDMRGLKSMPSAKQRARVAEWTRSLERIMVQYSLGYTNVSQSPLVRGALKAIDWLNPPKVPQAHFGTMTAACDWCIGRLRTAGLPITSSINAYRADLVAESAGARGRG
jgi:hypothetical protein